MFFSLRLVPAWLALLMLASIAQAIPPDPADAHAAVPAPGYTSALNSYRPATEQSTTPDKFWHAANDEVQNTAGHGTHMTGAGSSAAAPVPETEGPAGHGHDSHHGEGK